MIKKFSESLGNIEILVTPAQMNNAAAILERDILKAQRAFENMTQLIKNTSSYWEGNAANKERGRFEGEEENFAALIKNLTNYATELKLMTQIYEANEEATAKTAGCLPSDILD